jgi:hypothetical protein
LLWADRISNEKDIARIQVKVDDDDDDGDHDDGGNYNLFACP